MTNRISSKQESPATTFYLEADVIATDPNRSTNGAWQIRFYLRAINGPGGSSGSSYNGAGTQYGIQNASEFDRHSGNPFLPSGYGDGQQRWKDGPTDVWRNANGDGYWNGTSESMPLSMRLQYGSIDTTPGGSIPLPRIARAPGAPGTPTVSAITATSATFTWAAAARGNRNIDQYQWQLSTSVTMSPQVAAVQVGTALTDDTANDLTLTPGVEYFVRVRAHNADGWGAYSPIVSFRTLAGVYVSDGTTWKIAEVYVSDGSKWLPAVVNISDGATWKAAGQT